MESSSHDDIVIPLSSCLVGKGLVKPQVCHEQQYALVGDVNIQIQLPFILWRDVQLSTEW